MAKYVDGMDWFDSDEYRYGTKPSSDTTQTRNPHKLRNHRERGEVKMGGITYSEMSKLTGLSITVLRKRKQRGEFKDKLHSIHSFILKINPKAFDPIDIIGPKIP